LEVHHIPIGHLQTDAFQPFPEGFHYYLTQYRYNRGYFQFEKIKPFLIWLGERNDCISIANEMLKEGPGLIFKSLSLSYFPWQKRVTARVTVSPAVIFLVRKPNTIRGFPQPVCFSATP